MCIDDQWHEVKRSMLVANNSQPLQNISVVIADSHSVMIKWCGQQSIFFFFNSPNDKNISGYDLSCTTSSLSDHEQIHEVRVYPTLVQAPLGSRSVDYYQACARHTSAVSMHTYRQPLHLI